MTDGMREAYGASKVSDPNTPTPRAVEVPECVRALVNREIDSLRTSQNTLRMSAAVCAHGTTWADDLDRQKRLRATEERLAKVTATLAALEAWRALLSGPEVGDAD